MFLGLLLAGLTLLTISLQRTYARTSAKELKRRARAGDNLAAALFKAVTYGHSLRAVLWVLIGLSSAGFFVYVGRSLPIWQAFLVSFGLVSVGFVWLPAGKVTGIGEKLAGFLAPFIARVVYYLHSPLDRIIHFIRRHRPVHFHTGLYDRDDLVDFLDKQQVQADNRIEQAELDIARHAMVFGDTLISEVMTPRRMVKMVSVDDDLGPVLMTELHASGHSRFPVYEDKEDVIVGTLFMRDLISRRSGGKVRNAMKKQASYLHEEQSLHDALQAILKTHKHLYVVVNSFEEYVGIITIEDVLEQIVGHAIMDEFDQYEDLRSVAARAAKAEHQEHLDKETESIIEPEPKTEPEDAEFETPEPEPKKREPEVDDTIEID